MLLLFVLALVFLALVAPERRPMPRRRRLSLAGGFLLALVLLPVTAHALDLGSLFQLAGNFTHWDVGSLAVALYGGAMFARGLTPSYTWLGKACSFIIDGLKPTDHPAYAATSSSSQAIAAAPAPAPKV